MRFKDSRTGSSGRFALVLISLVLSSLSCTLIQFLSPDPPFKAPGGDQPTLTLFPRPTLSTPVPEVKTPTATSLVSSSTQTPLPPTPPTPLLYYSQAGDTLPVVAVRFGVEPPEITSPDPIPETGLLNPGQLLIIPNRLANTTSPQHLIPDSDAVFSPSAIDFDIKAFADQAGGYLSAYAEWLPSTGVTSGPDLVMRLAADNSINPRLLLALLEYQSGWVYGNPLDSTKIDYPFGKVDENIKGLYHQLTWAVNQLSIGYYGWREGRLTEIHFLEPAPGIVARLAPDLNAGTAAIQYYFAQLNDSQGWLQAMDATTGFPALYVRMFGNPWVRAMSVEPLYPPNLTQPRLILPFAIGQIWAYTGGPHGAWERDGAWAALDFAPGSTESGCVVSYAWAESSAAGLVVRSGNGAVAIDLDGDGREQTGWVLVYLHIAKDGRIAQGEWVEAGDSIGHPSCEGGFSTGTHLHIARKYNGEWIVADGPIPFVLNGWVAHAGANPYDGTLVRDGETITASQLGAGYSNIIRHSDDP